MTEALEVIEALLQPFTSPQSRTWVPALLGSGVVAAAVLLWRGTPLMALPRALFPGELVRHRSSRLDLQILLFRRLLGVLGVLPQLAGAWWLATEVAMALGRVLPRLDAEAWQVTLTYSVVLFVTWDASRYVLHRLMHRVPALWHLHQVHHSAPVLTPLTFFRLHPLESWLYTLRGTLVTGTVAGLFFALFGTDAVEWQLFGAHGAILLLNVVFGNLRHSHVPLGFGDVLEGWFISPAQHQLHHSIEAEEQQSNYGTWLAVWDRLGGTLRRSHGVAPARMGLALPNHDDTLLSAMLSPLMAILYRREALALLLFLLPAVASAQEAPEADEEEEEDEFVIVVESEGGVPRTAGSAHTIDAETLEQQEYDDIHRVLAEVPGVYVRGEDGYGLRPNIGIRGVSSDRSSKVTLLEDGVLFAPAPYAAPAAYYFPMATRMVGIEVFKGPAATQYGPNTVGGVINLRTRDTPRDGLAGELDVAGGNYSLAKGHAWLGWGNERFGVLLEGVHLSSDGFREPDDGGYAGFVHQESMLKVRLNSDPSLSTLHTLQLKLGWAWEDSRESYLGPSSEDFWETPYRRYGVDADARMRFDRRQAELSYRLQLGEVELHSVVYHHYLDRWWNKFNGFVSGVDVHDVLLNPDSGQAAVYASILQGESDTIADEQQLYVGPRDRQFWSSGWQTTVRWNFRRDRISSRLEGGVRLHGDQVHRVHTQDRFDYIDGALVPTGAETETTLDADSSALALAAHLHEDLAIGPVRVLAGSRVEVIDTWIEEAGAEPVTGLTAVVLPGLGVHATPLWWLQFFGGVHRGFTPVSPGSAEGTLPELSWNFEAGTRLQPGRTYAELLGFFNDYQNIAGQCTISAGCEDSDLGTQFSGGKALVYGIEANIAQEVPLPAQLHLRASLTWTWTGTRFRTSFVSSFDQYGNVVVGDAFPYVPEHQGAARLTLSHPRGTWMLAANYRGAMRDVAGQGDIPEDELIPEVLLFDTSINVHLHERFKLYATLNNVLGTVYLESLRPYGARPGAPRQLMVGAKIRL